MCHIPAFGVICWRADPRDHRKVPIKFSSFCPRGQNYQHVVSEEECATRSYLLNVSSGRKSSASKKLTACRVASEAIADNDDGALRSFTVDMLGLPPKWAPYVAIAMWNGNWMHADNPYGWIRTVTARTVKKWQPELVGQSWRERDAKTVLATDLGKVHAEDGYAYREGATGALGFRLHLAEEGGISTPDGKFMIGDGHKRNGRRWRNPNRPKPPMKRPGESRLGSDDHALIDARLRGCTRQTAANYLNWSQSKVERVWRRINRDQNQ